MKNIKPFGKWLLNEAFISDFLRITTVEEFMEEPLYNPNVDPSSNPLVLVIDINPAISFKGHSQKFISDVLDISNSLGVSEAIIIYTNGTKISDVDYVKRGEKPNEPDFSKPPKHVGGAKTHETYDLAFDWIQKNDIDPLCVIYFTTGIWKYPSKSQYGISRYADRILWAINDPGFNLATPKGKPNIYREKYWTRDDYYFNDLKKDSIPPFGKYAIINRDY